MCVNHVNARQDHAEMCQQFWQTLLLGKSQSAEIDWGYIISKPYTVKYIVFQMTVVRYLYFKILAI